MLEPMPVPEPEPMPEPMPVPEPEPMPEPMPVPKPEPAPADSPEPPTMPEAVASASEGALPTVEMRPEQVAEETLRPQVTEAAPVNTTDEGAEGEALCPACGAPILSSYRFCMQCGARL